MKIALANDHAGFPAREETLQMLRKAGHEVMDLGAASPESVDYPDYAERACRAVLVGDAERAILICGTGQGMAMAANHMRGIRAARCVTVNDARLSRAHNDANVIALCGWDDPKFDARNEIIEAWLTTEFEGGRHQRRVDKIDQMDQV